MKRTLAAIGLAGVLACPAFAQDTNIPTPWDKVIQFLGQGSNWITAVYGIASTDHSTYGGGIGLGYRLSDFVVPFLRVDALQRADTKDLEIWMPSGSLQLQVPFHLFGNTNFWVTPFAFGGIATPVSGRGVDNGSLVGIFGAGAAVRYKEHFGLIADYEKWSGFDGDQIRFGAYWKF